MQTVFMESPNGDEIKEIEATTEKLTPLMVAGWHQVPPPPDHKPAQEENQHG